jgi:hypothetical protein
LARLPVSIDSFVKAHSEATLFGSSRWLILVESLKKPKQTPPKCSVLLLANQSLKMIK